ncbi:MAG: class II aldolase/adducin family protein [Frankiaceae bacterium]
MPLAAAHAALAGQLAAAGRTAVARGLVVGSGGNLSARLPGAGELVVTAAGSWLDALSEDRFAVIGVDGTVRGGAATPTSEWRLHVESYRARPDVNAVVHLHPQASVLLDALGHPIRCITTDHVAYVDRVVSTPFHPCGTQELAEVAAAALADANCVVLAHHGCSVVADSVELALKRALNLEEAAALTYRALLLGDAATECPPAYREHLRRTAPGQH